MEQSDQRGPMLPMLPMAMRLKHMSAMFPIPLEWGRLVAKDLRFAKIPESIRMRLASSAKDPPHLS
jgi:hypothetical protein